MCIHFTQTIQNMGFFGIKYEKRITEQLQAMFISTITPDKITLCQNCFLQIYIWSPSTFIKNILKCTDFSWPTILKIFSKNVIFEPICVNNFYSTKTIYRNRFLKRGLIASILLDLTGQPMFSTFQCQCASTPWWALLKIIFNSDKKG